MATELPENCLRGIHNTLTGSKKILSIEYLNSGHFMFNKNEDRKDDFDEMSINWWDEDDVVMFTLNQKNAKGYYQYKYGAALLGVEEITKISRWVKIFDDIRLEKQKIPGNDYHGNILVSKNVNSNRRNLFGGMMALHVKEVYARD